jgi:hypothetical protein
LKTDDELLKEQASKMIEWIKETQHPMQQEHFSFLKDITKRKD